MLRIAVRLLAAITVLAALGAGSVAPAVAGGGCHGPDGTVHTEGDATVVRMDTCAFAPTVVHVPVGTEVRFLNTAQVDHLVVGEAQSWGTDDVLQPGQDTSRRFATKGVFPFSCPLHPGMVGAVVVGGADAAAVLPPAAGGAGSDVAPAASSTTPVSDGPSILPIVGVAILAAAILVGGGLIARRVGRPAAVRES
jgi:plastocyanin